jgi:hypothetical protein
MKIRNGFVSNSSSSSFIVGIAKINDIIKFDEFINKNKIKLDDYETQVVSLGEIKTGEIYSCKLYKDNINVISFDSDVLISAKDTNDDDLFFITNISNDEGDGAFVDLNDDLDYDIDLSFFDSKQQNIFNMFYNSESGLDLKNKDVTFGAGRNG